MSVKKKNLVLITLFLIFAIIGILGNYSYDFMTSKQALGAAFKWCGIPTLMFAVYYAYRSTFGHDSSIPVWKNLLATVVITIIVSMITLLSFKGLLIRINCRLGLQKDYLLSGQILKLNYPEKKKAGNSYSLQIIREIEKDTIDLEVPTNRYLTGEKFNKLMKIGSLGFIYSKN